jgi:hypothetical protein
MSTQILGPITYFRGDDWPMTITVVDQTTKVPVDITGFSFVLTVNSEQNPTDTTHQTFTVTGVIVSGAEGRVSFTPTTVQTNITAQVYYYDIQMVDGGGHRKTVVKDTFTITQDIGKS